MQIRSRGFETLPVVVKNLLIINGLFFMATIALKKMQIDLESLFALHYWESEKFKVWQFVTHMFMHADIMHLFSNMFALWMFGSILENNFGPKRFLTFYMLCGIGASFLHMGVLAYNFIELKQAVAAFDVNPTVKGFSSFLTQHNIMDPELNKFLTIWTSSPMEDGFKHVGSKLLHSEFIRIINEPTLGASGAVFGILFAFGYLFPNTEMMLLFIPFPIKAKYFVGAYALFELYAGFNPTAGDNIAHFAHLGGMLVAFIILKIWNKTHRNHFY